MKQSRIRRIIISSDEHDLPAEARAAMEQHAEYRGLHDRSVYLRRLIALKRYELPEAGARERCVETLRRRIEWQAALEEHRREQEPARFGGQVFRYGMAAAVAAVLAVHAYTINRLPSLNSLVTPGEMQTRSFSEAFLASNAGPYRVNLRSPFDLTPTLPPGYQEGVFQAVPVRRTNGNHRLIFAE